MPGLHPGGSLGLRKEICNSYQNVDMEHLMVANGTSEALFAFFNILLNKGDEVVCHFPAFQCLYQVPISIGCDMKFLDLSECEKDKADHYQYPSQSLWVDTL